MGSYARLPEGDGWSDDEDEEPTEKLGTMLSGRLAGIDIDSVDAVREVRERR